MSTDRDSRSNPNVPYVTYDDAGNIVKYGTCPRSELSKQLRQGGRAKHFAEADAMPVGRTQRVKRLRADGRAEIEDKPHD